MISGIFEMPITDESYPFSSAERYCHLSAKDYVEREYRVDGTANVYRTVDEDGGVEVIKGLHERGYKLGIISNLIGENEVPDWLEEDGLDSYFCLLYTSPSPRDA